MSGMAGPILITLAALVGLIFAGWVIFSWLQDQYAPPLREADRAVLPERELEA